MCSFEGILQDFLGSSNIPTFCLSIFTCNNLFQRNDLGISQFTYKEIHYTAVNNSKTT